MHLIFRHCRQSCQRIFYAKDYISGALAAMLDLGQGSGPLDHAFALTPRKNFAGKNLS